VLAQRDAMLAGEPSTTEGRAVMHWLLRMPRDGGQLRHCATVQQWQPAMHEALARCTRRWTPCWPWPSRCVATSITDIVNIGIGGSHLGPEVVVNALEDWVDAGKNFISSPTSMAMSWAMCCAGCPDSTLFLIASKSFTTAETMLNAHSARRWFLEQGGSEDPQAACSIDRHFVALTTNVQAAADFGIRRTLGFWDWVGGRFSLWSAIGLPMAIAIGAAQFRALLAGPCHGRAFFSPPWSATCRCAWACWTSGIAISAASPAAALPLQPWPAPADRPICSSWRWRATARA
jgi:glucose-6-phosphate isomerase